MAVTNKWRESWTKNNKPWHLLSKGNHVSAELQKQRIKVCEGCSEFLRVPRQCAVCGCFMDLKTKLKQAECPIGKWGISE